MERKLLKHLLTAGALLLGSAVQAEMQLDASFELALINGGPQPSFQDATLSKQRFGSDNDGLRFMNGYLQLQSDIEAVWNTKLTVAANERWDSGIGIVDAFFQYRPLPSRGVRTRVKFGAFRPPLSFEHGANGWETLYTTNASAISSWEGEELGMLGVELSFKRDLASARSRNYWSLGGATFYGNDTAGTLLSWRGWSLNNWQTPWDGHIRLAPLPVFRMIPYQQQKAEPFLELDDRPGFYGYVEVGRAGRLRLRYLYYDNHADPIAQDKGQIGWRARFESLALQTELPFRVGLIAQWLDGITYAGPKIWGTKRAVDNGYDAQFVMLTRSAGDHRLSVRRDWFDVDDYDPSPIDPNQENGTAWTLSYQYRIDAHWLLGLEWLRIDSRRPARSLLGEKAVLREDAWFAVVRWHL